MFLIPISRELDYTQYKDAHFMGTVTFTPHIFLVKYIIIFIQKW